jgi:predicted branched-subunit amino acid permease
MAARRSEPRPNSGGSAPEPGRERRAAARARRMRRRQRNLVLGLLAVTWVPGLLGAAFGASSLRSWGALAGYTGLSWAFPAVFLGLMVDRSIRERGLRGHGLLGVAAAGLAAFVLLLAAASLIGG